jgi:hypothetical protein
MPVCPSGKRSVVRHTHHPGPRQIPDGHKDQLASTPPSGSSHAHRGRSSYRRLRSSTTTIRSGRNQRERPKPLPSVPSRTWQPSQATNRMKSLFTMLNHIAMRSTEQHRATTRPQTAMAPNSHSTSTQRGSATFLLIRSNQCVVELDGFEPTTSCLQSRRSPS